MQFPSASNDRLMFAPSRNLAPRFFVTVALSDPAKSTRHSFPALTNVVVLAVRSCCWTNTYASHSRTHTSLVTVSAITISAYLLSTDIFLHICKNPRRTTIIIIIGLHTTNHHVDREIKVSKSKTC